MYSSDTIRKVVDAIQDDLIALFHAILEDDTVGVNTKVWKNTLADSRLHNEISTKVTTDFSFSLFYNDYLEYVERGRKPLEKKVPVRALLAWAKRKGLPTDNEFIYAVRQSIYNKGIPPRPIIPYLSVEIDDLFDKSWSQQLFNAITEELDKYFNN